MIKKGSHLLCHFGMNRAVYRRMELKSTMKCFIGNLGKFAISMIVERVHLVACLYVGADTS